MISARAWEAFMYMQERAGKVEAAHRESTRWPIIGSLAIGPAISELSTLRHNYDGTFYVLALPEQSKEIQSVGMQAIAGDMHDLPFSSGSFQRAFAGNVLEHSPAPYFALIEIRRVLTDGGEAHFAMPQFDGPEGGDGMLHLHCLTAAVWSELLRKTGFEVREQRDERGAYDPRAGYHIFHCIAGNPPHPHDYVLAEIWNAK